MLTPEEFKKQWDEECYPLVKISQHILDDFNIPDDAKRFLAEAGVPEDDYLGYPFDANLPRLPNSFPGTKRYPASYERYRAFGDVGYECYACIDEMEQGRIVYVSVFNGGPFVRFVNSSIQQLAECWLVADKYGPLVERKEVWSDDALRNKYADLWEEELRRVDPAIFIEDYSVWHGRIEGIREGRVE